MTKRLLLHICCGPCSITTLQMLIGEGYEVTGLFYNPNIHPLTEYVKRRDGCLAVASKLGIKVIVKDDEYRPQEWFRAVAYRENNRCFHCYAQRMERTAQIAKKGKFDFFSTTLLYSKYQRHDAIAALGRDLQSPSTQFLYHDFRVGWQEGIETSKKWDIYRQQYCGCLYSENERYTKKLGVSR
jgi:predicted adenine nucleotide alpha hydrolase (AANH) superfamily ATPase